MKELPKALDLKNKVLNIRETKLEEEWNIIVEHILIKSKDGLFKVSLSKNPSSAIVAKLQELGYKTNFYSDCRDTLFTISWD